MTHCGVAVLGNLKNTGLTESTQILMLKTKPKNKNHKRTRKFLKVMNIRSTLIMVIGTIVVYIGPDSSKSIL